MRPRRGPAARLPRSRGLLAAAVLLPVLSALLAFPGSGRSQEREPGLRPAGDDAIARQLLDERPDVLTGRFAGRLPHLHDLPAPRESGTPPPVELQIFAGFDPDVAAGKENHWMPVLCRIYNHRSAALVARLTVGSSSEGALDPSRATVRKDVRVGARQVSDHRLILPLSSRGRALMAELHEAIGAGGARQGAPMAAPAFVGGARVLAPEESRHFVVLDHDRGILPREDRSPRSHQGLQGLPFTGPTSGGLRPSMIAVDYPVPAMMPERWQAYEGVDAVFVADAGLFRGLAEAQRDALRTWVRMGGLLVLECPDGVQARRYLEDPWIASVVPLDPADPTEESLPWRVTAGWEPLAGPDGIVQIAATHRGEPVPGASGPGSEVEFEDATPGQTLVVRAPCGLGRLTFLACPFPRWTAPRSTGQARRLRSILFGKGREGALPLTGQGSAGRFWKALGSAEALVIPGHRSILLFLLAYLLVLGPVAFVVHGRTGGSLRVWGIGLPVVVALFTLIAWTRLCPRRPAGWIQWEVGSVVAAGDGRGCLLVSHIGIQAPAAAEVRVRSTTPGVTLAHPGGEDIRGLEREPHHYRDAGELEIERVRTFAHARLPLVAVAEHEDTVPIEFEAIGDTWENGFRLVNRSAHHLEDVLVRLTDGSFRRTGALPPGGGTSGSYPTGTDSTSIEAFLAPLVGADPYIEEVARYRIEELVERHRYLAVGLVRSSLTGLSVEVAGTAAPVTVQRNLVTLLARPAGLSGLPPNEVTR